MTPAGRLARTVDAVLEGTVVGGFSRIGPVVRQRVFGWSVDDAPAVPGRVVVLTGATSGIGRAAAAMLARRGAHLVVVGRSPERTAAVAAELDPDAVAAGGSCRAVVADLSDLSAVRRAGDEIAGLHPTVDVVLHNAGALVHERRLTPEGLESTVAAQVVGPHLLTSRLLGSLTASGDARVITMTSGGMYAERLSLSRLTGTEGDFDGVRAYARAKRAQVALAEVWARRPEAEGVLFATVHPGWAATPGVADALPGFDRVMGPLLRSPDEGADGMVWLACAPRAEVFRAPNGSLWLDRRPRSAHRIPTTRRRDEAAEAQRMWEWVSDQVAPYLA